MNEYNVSDYGIFTNAISTANTLKSKIGLGKDAIASSKTILGNEAVFMGPAADSCLEVITSADAKLTDAVSNFGTIANFLQQTAENYKSGDQAAAGALENIASIMSTDNGTVIYYSQKGYYDQNGNFHQWSSSWGKSIASSGCGPTSMAACLANLFHDPSITPSTVANMLGYNDNIGGNYVGKVANAYNLDQSCHIGLGRDSMNTFLSNGGKMIVAVNGGGHYIAILGINNSTNPPTYIVDDPYDDNTANKVWRYEDISQGHTMVFHIAPPGKSVQQCLQPTTVQV